MEEHRQCERCDPRQTLQTSTWPFGHLATTDGRRPRRHDTTADDSQHFCNCHNVVFVFLPSPTWPTSILLPPLPSFSLQFLLLAHFGIHILLFSAFCFAHCANLALLFPKANSKKTQRQQRAAQVESSRAKPNQTKSGQNN